ncbi:hypothetical protein, partial [Caballeronia calidae]|uniref:hypothetical protein n=1 Tax=Caballeronia calidae TaxID=1777139 RepID=UPI000A98DD96
MSHNKATYFVVQGSLFRAEALLLVSAEFGAVLGLCGQSEHLEGVRVLPFGDEFREEIGFGA